MNNQVRAFFDRMKQQAVQPRPQPALPFARGPIAEQYEVTLFLYNEATHGVPLKVSDDDLEFVHAARQLAKTTPGGKVPPMYKAILARYMLLHPLPLHKFHMDWDDHSEVMHIFETRPRPDESEHAIPVAKVDKQMRTDYEFATKRKAKPGEEGDAEVARWWMEENKNALLFPGRKPQVKDESGKRVTDKTASPGNPTPQAKILRVGSDSVDIAFKNDGRHYTWTPVRNIPVDMEKFRKQVESQGFDTKRHAPFLLRLDHTTWKKLLKATDDDDARPEMSNPKFVPGHNVPFEKADPEFRKNFEENPEFKKKVMEAIVKAVAKYAGSIRGFAKGAVKINVDWNDPEKYGNPSTYFISIDRDRAWIPGLDYQMVQDIIMDTLAYVQKNSGHGDLEEDPDFLYKTAVTGAKNSIGKIIRDPNRRAHDIGGAGDAQSKSNQGRAGGRRDVAVVGGEGGGTGGAGYDVTKRDGSGAEKVGRFTGDRTGDFKGDKGYSVEDLLSAVRSNPASMTNDEEIQRYILRYAHNNPVIAQLANHLIDNELLLPGVEAPGEDHGTDKYSPAARPTMARHENVRHMTFMDYLQKRGGLNEMGVVWGNDRKSAKVIKPGQTLKGGIQVSGAPWSAGGKGDPNNDIQVR